MITWIFKRQIVPEGLMLQILQGLVVLAVALIFVVGFLKMTALELTEAQLSLGIGILFSLLLQCGILLLLIDRKRKAA